MDYRELAGLALSARANAYAPYSGFLVGAALLTRDGGFFTGCNVESAALSPTNCAERTAVYKAVSEGFREFRAIAVAGGSGAQPVDYCWPCGVCRQVLVEFARDEQPLYIIAVKTADDYLVCTLAELLPRPFGPRNVEEAPR